MKKRVISPVTLTSLLLLIVLLLPDAVLAQTGDAGVFGAGFSHGFMHPLLGLDHLLSMLCVGVISSQLGGRAIWLVPATFVAVLGFGGMLGILGVALPGVEVIIALSVVALGAAILAEKRLPIYITLLLIGLFALFHGQAHGAEMPSTTEPIQYALGFMMASAFIHIIGLGIGEIMTRSRQRAFTLRLAGGLVVCAGILILTGLI